MAVATALAPSAGMRLVMTVDRSAGTPWLTQLLDFHRAAGVDAFVDSAGEADADWLIECQPNEFWWPRGSSLKDILEAVPANYGEVDAVVRHFVPIAHERSLERMTYRLSPNAAFNAASSWRPERKRIRRQARSVRRPLRGWYPVEVLSFHADTGDGLDEAAIARAVKDGILTRDERLQNALRMLAAGVALAFAPPTIVEDASFAADVAALGDADVISVRERIDAIEERLAAVESTIPVRLERRVRKLVKRRRDRS